MVQDHYKTLVVSQTCSSEVIKQAYRGLALELHPDRNHRHDAKEAFQRIAEAYETLSDESKRRAYDLQNFASQATASSSSYRSTHPQASPPQSNALSEAAEIASIQKSRNERFNRWRISRAAFSSAICGLLTEIKSLEHEIEVLSSIEAAEAVVEAWDRSWTMWLLSSWYKKLERNGDDKAHEDRDRQERRVRKILQERFLEMKRGALEEQRASYDKAKKDYELADSRDDGKIDVIRDRASKRRIREAQAAKAEAERVERLLREQAARQWELARRQREVIEEMELRRRRERSAHIAFSEAGRGCRHRGWWPKVQGRRACPKCGDIWTHLLECPSCRTSACPKCQHGMRSRSWHSNREYVQHYDDVW